MSCKTRRYINIFSTAARTPFSNHTNFYDLDGSPSNSSNPESESVSESSSNSNPSSKGGRCSWNCSRSPISLLSILPTYTRDRVVEEAYVVYIHLCLSLIQKMLVTCVFLCRVTNIQAPRPKNLGNIVNIKPAFVPKKPG